MKDGIEKNEGSTEEPQNTRTLTDDLSLNGHSRHEESLREQLQFEQMLSELSAAFINLPGEKVDEEIQTWIQRVGELLGIDLSMVWQLAADGVHYDVTHVCSTARPVSFPSTLPRSAFPWAAERLMRGEMVVFSRVNDLPQEAGNEKQLIEAIGLGSIAAFPLAGRGSHFGAVVFGTLNRERIWPDSLLRRLQLVGEIFANALVLRQSQEAVRKERDRARQYLDIAGVVLVALDSEQRVTMINQRGCVLLGYAEDEIIGRNWFASFLPPRIRDIVRATFESLMTGAAEPAVYYENPILSKTGQERLIAWNNTLLHDEQGKIIGTLSSGEDITERRQMERALRESKDRFERVAHQSREMVWEVDTGGVFTYVSPACEEILGYRPEEMISKMHFYDLQPENEREPFKLAAFEQIARRESFRNQVNKVRTKNGRVLWFLTSGAPVSDEYGTLKGYAGADLDITDRIIVEEMLAAERRLFIGGPTVIFKWKAVKDWPVEYVSPNVTDQFGYGQVEFTSGKRAYAAIVHPEDLQRVADELRAYGDSEAAFIEQEYRIVRADGEYRWVRDFTVLVRDQSGEVTHYHGYVLDITRRKRAEEELKENEEKFLKAFNSSPTMMSISTMEEDRFVEVNETFLTTLGFERGQVIGKTSTELGLYVQPQQRSAIMQIIREEGCARNFDCLILSRSGDIRDCLFSADTVELRGKRYLLSVVSDVTESKRFGTLLQYAVEGTSAETGRNFFRSMVEHLATALNMRYALIGEVTTPGFDAITTLAVWNSGKIGKNFQHSLAGCPCENIFNKMICLHPSGVRKLFPADQMLAELEVESFLGMPLADSSGQPLGILAVMNDKPLSETMIPHARSLVSIFAARAAAELERLRVEEELRQATERLKVEREELAEKNITLKQILDHLEREKIDYRHEISAGVENLMMPYVRKLRSGSGQLKNRELDALENAMESIVGKDIDQFLNNFAKLTPRERDICERIKAGLTSKQIAGALNIDVLTVHKHRDAIRRKLQLKHKGLNLTSFLRSR